jgi:hypothetical protein
VAGATAVRQLRAERAFPARPGPGRAGRRVRAPLARAVPRAAPCRARPRGRQPALGRRGSWLEPLYRATLWFDRGRLAEIAADAEGVADAPVDPRWAAGKALFAASLADQDVAREYLAVAMLLSTADEVFTQPGMAERVMRLGAGAARYPLPGPNRRELLAAIGA